MGFETVVRPAVFPNIRPQPTRALPIEDAPDKGLAVITGGGISGIINLSHSESHSWSRQRMVEVRRVFDIVRVYASNADGTLNPNVFIEYEVLRSIEYLENGHTAIGAQFAPFQEAENVEVMAHGLTRENK